MSNPRGNPATLRPKPWKPGQSGNPGGKPVGARNRLQGAYVGSLADDFDKHGKKAIIACREADPAAYLRAVGALMPKEIEVRRVFDELDDDTLNAALVAVRAILAAQGIGTGSDPETQAEPASALPAISQAS